MNPIISRTASPSSPGRKRLIQSVGARRGKCLEKLFSNSETPASRVHKASYVVRVRLHPFIIFYKSS